MLTPAEALAGQILDTLTPTEHAALAAHARIHTDMQDAAARIRQQLDDGEDG